MKIKFEFTVTGFVIALVLVGMFAFSFSYFTSELETEFSTVDNTTFSNYNNFAKINESAEEIRDATDIDQTSGALDVIGQYFTSGYSALKISLNSIGLFNDLTKQVAEDIPEFSIFRNYLTLIVIIALFLGIGISALLKWYV